MTKQKKKLARIKRLKKKMNVERSQKTKAEKETLRGGRIKVTWSHTKRPTSKVITRPLLTVSSQGDL